MDILNAPENFGNLGFSDNDIKSTRNVLITYYKKAEERLAALKQEVDKLE